MFASDLPAFSWQNPHHETPPARPPPFAARLATGGQTSAAARSLHSFLQTTFADARGNGPTRPMSAAFADLNGDGRDEALVSLYSGLFCGSGGCALYIYTPAGASWREVAELTIVNAPVRLLDYAQPWLARPRGRGARRRLRRCRARHGSPSTGGPMRPTLRWRPRAPPRRARAGADRRRAARAGRCSDDRCYLAAIVLLPIDVQQGFDDPSWPPRWNGEMEANGRALLAHWRAAGRRSSMCGTIGGGGLVACARPSGQRFPRGLRAAGRRADRFEKREFRFHRHRPGPEAAAARRGEDRGLRHLDRHVRLDDDPAPVQHGLDHGSGRRCLRLLRFA